jgi:hypothetical protein
MLLSKKPALSGFFVVMIQFPISKLKDFNILKSHPNLLRRRMDTLLIVFKGVSSEFGSHRENNLWLIDKLSEIFQTPIEKVHVSHTVGESFQIRSDGYKTPINQVAIKVKTLPFGQIPDEIAVSESILVLTQLLSREVKNSNTLYPAIIEFDLGGRKSQATIYEVDLFEESKLRLS